MLTKVKYLRDSRLWDIEIPYELFGYPVYDSGRITNCEYVTFDNVPVKDVRDIVSPFDLESAGFTYIKHHSTCPLLAEHFEKVGSDLSNNSVVAAYLEETMSLVERQLSAEKVICFDWRFRRSGTATNNEIEDDNVKEIRFKFLAPGHVVHCDFSHTGGADRMEMHLREEELETLYSGKWKAKIINVWRPLKTVKNAPLIITDRRSVKQEDLVEVEKVLPDKVERAYYLKHRDYHEWFYMSDQSPDDVAIFTTWDNSKGDDVADFPPHGAAMQFTDDPFEAPRESIEVRLIVFFDPGQQH